MRPREVAVVADVDADLSIFRLEHWVAEVARPEIELLPEPFDLRDMGLAVFTQIRAVGVNHGGSVVVDSALLLLIERHNQRHVMLLGDLLHAPGRRPVGHWLGEVVELGVLHLAEVGAGRKLLEAGDLRPLRSGLFDQADLSLDVLLHAHAAECLDQRATYDCHSRSSFEDIERRAARERGKGQEREKRGHSEY